MDRIAAFLGSAAAWACEDRAVAALLLVGSHARGCARPDSDIDLVVVCESEAVRDALLAHPGAFARFGPILRADVEDYGACTSLRVRYVDGLEAEFGFVAPSWILARPLDAGTRRVLSAGHRTLADRHGWLTGLEGLGAGEERA